MNDSELLTTGQAAALLGVSRQHVVNLCERGTLPHLNAGTHRRLRRADVELFARGQLTRDQERSLWLHRAVAGRLVLDPDGVLARGRGNLERLRRTHPTGMAATWLAQWQVVFDNGTDAVLEVLTSRASHAIELRQNSPFAGALTDRQRQAALSAFRAHWRREHAA